MFLPLKNLLSSRLAEHGALKGAVVAQMVEEFKKTVVGKWGDSARDMISEVFLKQDTLHIKTTNSALAQEIKLAETDLLSVLENKFPGKVKRLRIFS
ncbi:TPA: hypothetical protein DIC39_01500 [Patescibacteria group bacterium]|nr:hypothetical protein [Patescibacteria group bacterium]HCU47716.1 hypothetical protein [Patescibacteria group bacterium]